MNTNFMVHTSNGSIFEIDLDKPNWAQLIDDKTWVGPHYSFFSEIIKGRSYECPLLDIEEGDIVVDLGANIGVFSRLALAEKKASKVIAIEPHLINFNCLILNNGMNKNFSAYPFAISDNVGSILMPIGNAETEWHFTMANMDTKFPSSMIPCLTYSMDSLFESKIFEHIDFLKVDIEGAEVKMFEGLSDENLNKIAKIVIEYHYPLESIRMLKNRLSTMFDIVGVVENSYDLEIYFYKRRN